MAVAMAGLPSSWDCVQVQEGQGSLQGPLPLPWLPLLLLPPPQLSLSPLSVAVEEAVCGGKPSIDLISITSLLGLPILATFPLVPCKSC